MAILAMPSSSSSQKMKKGGGGKGRCRFLITVNVLGSAGPIRFVVSEGELVSAVISTALRSYAREGRLPVLGTHLHEFLLYCAGSDALSPGDSIGSNGSRNFLLCKKQHMVFSLPAGATVVEKSPEGASTVLSRKGSGGSWKSWINKSLSFKITSH